MQTIKGEYAQRQIQIFLREYVSYHLRFIFQKDNDLKQKVNTINKWPEKKKMKYSEMTQAELRLEFK